MEAPDRSTRGTRCAPSFGPVLTSSGTDRPVSPFLSLPRSLIKQPTRVGLEGAAVSTRGTTQPLDRATRGKRTASAWPTAERPRLAQTASAASRERPPSRDSGGFLRSVPVEALSPETCSPISTVAKLTLPPTEGKVNAMSDGHPTAREGYRTCRTGRSTVFLFPVPGCR